MRGNEFLDKMELVDSAFIEAASNDIIEKKTRRKKHEWIKWSAMAACLALIAFLGLNDFSPKTDGKTSEYMSENTLENTSDQEFQEPSANMSDTSSELPKLTVSQNLVDGAGFEGLMAYDISELVNANPWNEEMGLTHLPVYENRFLGEDSTTTVIDFDPTINLPDEYHFTYYSTQGEILEVANYLKEEYEDVIGFADSQINIYGGDYCIDRQQRYSLEFYKKGDNDVEQIVNYNFNRAVFYAGESNELSMIRIFEPDLTKKVGDYPIITSDEALELLLEEKYITTVPYEVQGKEYVSKVELIYRTGQYEEYFMPYYRFYVEVPEETKEDGLKTYGAYYVPAVKGEYLSDVETWNGNFQ